MLNKTILKFQNNIRMAICFQITCVGAKLSYTISNLQKGREYYFNIFAKNRRTHLSFLYANKFLKYETRTRPLGLRDNKPVTVNIRRLGGKAIFRYKVLKFIPYI